LRQRVREVEREKLEQCFSRAVSTVWTNVHAVLFGVGADSLDVPLIEAQVDHKLVGRHAR
jgi:hypothetical protein